MSRLPTVGSDNGNWGTILNDYLSVSHEANGTLKSSAITLSADYEAAIRNITLTGSSPTAGYVEVNMAAGQTTSPLVVKDSSGKEVFKFTPQSFDYNGVLNQPHALISTAAFLQGDDTYNEAYFGTFARSADASYSHLFIDAAAGNSPGDSYCIIDARAHDDSGGLATFIVNLTASKAEQIITMAAGQTAAPFTIEDSAGTDIFKVTGGANYPWFQLAASSGAGFVFAQTSKDSNDDTYIGIQQTAGQTGSALRLSDSTGNILWQWWDGYAYIKERPDPGAPGSDVGVLFMRDNGAGKTQMCVRFSTGAVQVIATEP